MAAESTVGGIVGVTGNVVVSGSVSGVERVGIRLTVRATVVDNGGWDVRFGTIMAAGAELAPVSATST